MRKISFLIIITLIFLSVGHAENITQTSLSISPAIVETILEPDNAVIKQIILTNLSNLPQPVKTLKQGFTPKEKLDLTPEELKIFDASSWITISDKDTDFILQPHESKRVTLKINQPANATPGGHYATIIFQPLIPQELVSQESIFVYSRVAVLVFMQTKGDIVQNLEFTGISMAQVMQGGNLGFDVTIKNTGNTHVQPSGKLNIYNDLTGQIVASEGFPSSIILPKTEKSFHIDTELNDFIGKYSVQTVLTYGDDSNVLKSDRQSFYLFPYTFIIFVVLPLILIIYIAFKYKSRFVLAYKILIQKDADAENIINKTPNATSLFKPRPRLKFKLNIGKKKKH